MGETEKSSLHVKGFYEGKLVKLLTDDKRELQQKMGRENRYIVLFDNPLIQSRTRVATYLQDKFKFQVIDIEKISTALKEKLGGEDGPLESLSFDQLLE